GQHVRADKFLQSGFCVGERVAQAINFSVFLSKLSLEGCKVVLATWWFIHVNIRLMTSGTVDVLQHLRDSCLHLYDPLISRTTIHLSATPTSLKRFVDQ